MAEDKLREIAAKHWLSQGYRPCGSDLCTETLPSNVLAALREVERETLREAADYLLSKAVVSSVRARPLVP